MIPLFKVFMNEKIDEDVVPVLKSGMITQASQVEKFEQELSKVLENPYVLTVNSCTSALTLAFRLLNLSKDDEVLSCPLTCFASNASILANGLNIKWVDVDKDTCNMSLDDLERKITKNTKAILLVHWGGTPVDLHRVKQIVSNYEDTYGTHIDIVEDCAHSFGTTYLGVPLGNHGNICCYSFQAIKQLTTGDGGLISLPTKELYDRAKLLRWYGIDRDKRNMKHKDFRMENDIVEWGYKFHMNDINATIGLSNLPFISDNLKICRDNARYYTENLRNIKGLSLFKYSTDSTYWIYSLRICEKEDFIPYMKERNIVVSQVHNRNDIHSCVRKYKTNLPNLDDLERELVCIPCGWWITSKDREYIVKCIKEWCNRHTIICREIMYDEVKDPNYRKQRENGTRTFVVKDNEKDKIMCSATIHILEHDNKRECYIQSINITPEDYNKYYEEILVKFIKEYVFSQNCSDISCKNIDDRDNWINNGFSEREIKVMNIV